MISSPSISEDEDKREEVMSPEVEEPLAPLAVPLSTGMSTTGPTPTPSSAAMTISVEGFFEDEDERIMIRKSQDYEYYFYDEVEECGMGRGGRPIASEDEDEDGRHPDDNVFSISGAGEHRSSGPEGLHGRHRRKDHSLRRKRPRPDSSHHLC